MSRQWLGVGAIVVGLVVGAGALVHFAPDSGRVEVGARAPDFEVYDLGTGDSISLRKQYGGSVTLINIWATWCLPCREEMPAMQRLFDSTTARGFRIAAVSIDEGSPQAVRAFGKELNLTFDLLQDRTTKIQDVYQTTGVPESFLIDKEGVIVKRVIGAHDWSSPVNRSLVERLLADSVDP